MILAAFLPSGSDHACGWRSCKLRRRSKDWVRPRHHNGTSFGSSGKAAGMAAAACMSEQKGPVRKHHFRSIGLENPAQPPSRGSDARPLKRASCSYSCSGVTDRSHFTTSPHPSRHPSPGFIAATPSTFARAHLHRSTMADPHYLDGFVVPPLLSLGLAMASSLPDYGCDRRTAIESLEVRLGIPRRPLGHSPLLSLRLATPAAHPLPRQAAHQASGHPWHPRHRVPLQGIYHNDSAAFSRHEDQLELKVQRIYALPPCPTSYAEPRTNPASSHARASAIVTIHVQGVGVRLPRSSHHKHHHKHASITKASRACTSPAHSPAALSWEQQEELSSKGS